MSTDPVIPSPPQPRPPLGVVDLSKDALDPDWKLADGYIAYSGELLRLSLLAIGGIATLCLSLSQKGKSWHTLMWIFSLPLVGFLLSTGFALAHRFTAMDSMAFHIASIRLRKRGAGAYEDSGCQNHADLIESKKQAKGRDLRFTLADWSIRFSAFFLFLGVLCAIRSLGMLPN
jgi:hypothetical protein